MATVTTSTTRDRILDALIRRVEDVGLAKLTMDDIAQRAGLSRVTLYGYFPNKQEILRTAVLRELERFFTELDAVAGEYDEPEERLVETFAHAYRELRGHPLLERLIRSEPEAFATYLARETPAIPLARGWLAAKIAEADVLHSVEAERAAEFIVRLMHSLLIAPANAFGLEQPGQPQEFVRRWIMPALRV
jgi:AcrR family transcriptional regulator